MKSRFARRGAVLLGLAGAVAGAAALSAPAAQAQTAQTAQTARPAHSSRPGLLVLDKSHGSLNDNPVANYYATKACPGANRADALVALEQNDGTYLDAMTPDFTPTGALPHGSLNSNSLALFVLTFGLQSGDYKVALLCSNDDGSSLATADTITIKIDTVAGTWKVDWCATLVSVLADTVPAADKGRVAA